MNLTSLNALPFPTRGLAAAAIVWSTAICPCSQARAQDVPDEDRPIAPALGVDATRVHESPSPGGTWLRAPSYKARVSPAGLTFVPFLGADAPRSYPTTFRVTSVRQGSTDLDLESARPLAPVSAAHGQRWSLDRGPLQVHYDVRFGEIEQLFEIAAQPDAGSLELTVEISSSLMPQAEADGWRWIGPEGGFTYGAAFAVTPGGLTPPLTSNLVPSAARRSDQDGELFELTLTVPESIVRESNGLVLIDPVLTAYAVDSVDGLQQDPDVTYDRTSDTFLYVHEDMFSGTDMDIYAVVADVDGNKSWEGYVDAGLDSWMDPSVANHDLTDHSLVVATREGAAGGGYGDIVGRVFDHANASFGTTFVIDPASAGFANGRADVGGSFSPSSNSGFAVCYERDYGSDRDIQVQILRPDGSLNAVEVLEASFDRDSREVVVSESTGDPTSVDLWNFAFVQRELTSNEESIQTAQMNELGMVVSGPNPAVPQGTETFSQLDVSDALSLGGADPTYLIAFRRTNPVLGELSLATCRNGFPVRQEAVYQREHADAGRFVGAPTLATTSEDFVLTYLESTPGIGWQIYSTAFDLVGGALLGVSERRTPIGVIGQFYHQGGGLAAASRFSGGRTSSRYTAIAREVGFGTDADIEATIHFASNPPCPVYQYCEGNVNSTGERGFITMGGNAGTTDQKSLLASGLPPSTFGYFLVGTGSQTVHHPGGSAGVLCVSGPIGRYSNFVSQTTATGELQLFIDPSAIQRPNGATAAVAGDVYRFTAWHRDSVAGVATSNFTNAITLVFE